MVKDDDGDEYGTINGEHIYDPIRSSCYRSSSRLQIKTKNELV